MEIFLHSTDRFDVCMDGFSNMQLKNQFHTPHSLIRSYHTRALAIVHEEELSNCTDHADPSDGTIFPIFIIHSGINVTGSRVFTVTITYCRHACIYTHSGKQHASLLGHYIIYTRETVTVVVHQINCHL